MRYRSLHDKSCKLSNGESYLILRNEVIQIDLSINDDVHATLNGIDILLRSEDLEEFTKIPKRISY